MIMRRKIQYLILVTPLFLLAVVPTLAGGDSDPPHLLDFDFEPKMVDTSVSSALITFTLHLTDDLSGVANGVATPTQILFRGPSTYQFVYTTFDANDTLVLGDEMDGVFRNSMELPRFSETGLWSVDWLLLNDNLGNGEWLYYEDVAALGYPASFWVGGAGGDSDPPHLLDFDFEPKMVDTSVSSALITFTLHLTDDLSGVANGVATPTQILFRGPSTYQFVYTTFDANDTLVLGDEMDGVFRNSMELPRFSETGLWSVDWLLLNDNLGNGEWLYYEDVAALGYPASFWVGSVRHQTYLPIASRW